MIGRASLYTWGTSLSNLSKMKPHSVSNKDISEPPEDTNKVSSNLLDMKGLSNSLPNFSNQNKKGDSLRHPEKVQKKIIQKLLLLVLQK